MRGKALFCPVILHKAPLLQTSTGWTKVSLFFVLSSFSSASLFDSQSDILFLVQSVCLPACVIPALHCRAFPLKQINASDVVSGLWIFIFICFYLLVLNFLLSFFFFTESESLLS